MLLPRSAVTMPPDRLLRLHPLCARAVRAALLAAALMLPAAATAAPVTFAFETALAGSPYGHGSFTIDDALFPYPHVVIGSWPAAPDVFLDFSYSDPHVGSFGKGDVAAVHFEIGINPHTSLWEPAISLWAFVLANADNSRVLQGSVSGLDPLGNLNTLSIVQPPQGAPQIQHLTAYFPQQVPEPAALLLLGTAAGGWVLRRARR